MNDFPRLLLAALLALAASGVAAQDPDPAESGETPAPEAAQTLGEAALTADDADEAGDADLAEPDAGEETGEEAADGAEAEIKATMEKFVPSEQISEDRSVSFPNDI